MMKGKRMAAPVEPEPALEPGPDIRRGKERQRLNSFLRKNVANLITLGRIPLCFASFACAILVILNVPSKIGWGFVGELLLIAAALTDYFDGMVARRLNVMTKMGPLADQMMDKMVYCIIFPTISVGIMEIDGRNNIDHVVIALVLCVTMLVRDHYVNFLRVLADRHQGDSSVHRVGKLRTVWALPTSCILYAYCFARGEPSDIFYLNALTIWVRHIDVVCFVILEISLFVINVVSVISYTRLYGPYLLKELCGDDEEEKRRILSLFPNSLTLMNAVMGLVAIVMASRERFHLAFVMLMAAAIFDKLDGAAARKLGLAEDQLPGKRRITLGAILDDVADGISFCIAPAAIAYLYLQGYAWAPMAFLYTAGGIVRLVYFTLDKNPIPGFFKGLPSPAAALLSGGMVQAAHHFDPKGAMLGPGVALLFIGVSLMMNAYFLRYIHFGRLMSKSRALTHAVFAAMLVTMFSKYLGLFAVAIMAAYLVSPLYIKVPPSGTDDAPEPAPNPSD